MRLLSLQMQNVTELNFYDLCCSPALFLCFLLLSAAQLAIVQAQIMRI